MYKALLTGSTFGGVANCVSLLKDLQGPFTPLESECSGRVSHTFNQILYITVRHPPSATVYKYMYNMYMERGEWEG